MSQDWFVLQPDGQMDGPISEQEISQQLMAGRLADPQRVRQGSSGPWCDAKRARAVFARLIEQGWYVRDGDQEFGPFTQDRMRQLAVEGELSDQALVRQGTRLPWQPLTAAALLQPTTAGTAAGGGDAIALPAATAPVAKAESTGSVQPDANAVSAQAAPAGSPPPGAKWATEPPRHVVVTLDAVDPGVYQGCLPSERCWLSAETANGATPQIVVRRGNQQLLGRLPAAACQWVTAGQQRGERFVAMLSQQTTADRVQMILVACPPGVTASASRNYIDQLAAKRY